jgi:pseudaminic acid cytidylyltransferase
MNNLAVIPARSGSQRIPKKNIKDFFGKPIIAYPIEMALKSNLFDEVIVSTDSPEIESIVVKYGASVPFLRSEKNSNNFATLTDVILEVIQVYQKLDITIDSICCILPTAVLISHKSLSEGYNKFKNNHLSSLIAVVRFAYPIQRALKEESGLLSFREPEFAVTRSQDMEPYYHDSGQFYWIKTNEIVKEKSIFTSKTGYLELAEIEAQDVDTQTDWEILKIKFEYKNQIMQQ